jgi:hypothetical protein
MKPRTRDSLYRSKADQLKHILPENQVVVVEKRVAANKNLKAILQRTSRVSSACNNQITKPEEPQLGVSFAPHPHKNTNYLHRRSSRYFPSAAIRKALAAKSLETGWFRWVSATQRYPTTEDLPELDKGLRGV